jgi:hypothetical protein
MGGWCEGRCQEAGGEKLEECCKEQGQLAEASKEGLGSEWAVVPMMMMMNYLQKIRNWDNLRMEILTRNLTYLYEYVHGHLIPFARRVPFLR